MESSAIEDTQVTSPPVNGETSWLWSKIFGWLPSWKPTSEQLLVDSERAVLSELQSEYKDSYIRVGDQAFIRTFTMEAEQEPPAEKLPLVMMHGFGCGLGAFYRNYDGLHSERKLLSLDVLGFGRSSRVSFIADADRAEGEFVDSIENWRQSVGLDKFILLGHSFGAFLACSYAMKFPTRVRHLIMVDPWGFYIKPPQAESTWPLMYRAIGAFVSKFNPFSPIRVAGPLGPNLVKRFRPDLENKFGSPFMDYVYHCNAQYPTGESAFSNMQLSLGFSKRPMLERIDQLSSDVPVTFIYGTRSWMDSSSGEKFFSARPNSFVDVHFVSGAGHHVHAETPEVFNEIVNGVCKMIDNKTDIVAQGERRAEEEAFHRHGPTTKDSRRQQS